MLRLVQFFLAAGLLLSPAFAEDRPALVFDAKTGAVLHAEHANALWFPASLTKLMTSYVAFKAIEAGQVSLDTQLTISARALAEPPSKMGMPVGATIGLGNALEILIVKSANDLAVAIAEGVGGSVEQFVQRMNETAAALGMVDTRFVNPNGLPAHGQVTTARDLALLTSALIREFPQYGDMFALKAVKVGKRNLRSHNPLLGKYDGADGMKTGFICASGYNLVASATRNGRRIVAIILGASSNKSREDRAISLLDAAFAGKEKSQFLPGTLAQVERAAADAGPATHMGPVVCKKRYPAGRDAYAIDLQLQRAADERERVKAAKADIEENGPAGNLPMALAATTPLPQVIERLNASPPVKGKLAPGIPLPALRPAR